MQITINIGPLELANLLLQIETQHLDFLNQEKERWKQKIKDGVLNESHQQEPSGQPQEVGSEGTLTVVSDGRHTNTLDLPPNKGIHISGSQL